MIVKVWKTGNSLVVSIPAFIARTAGLKKGDNVEIIPVGGGKLEIGKVQFSSVAPVGAGKAGDDGK